MDEGEEDCGNLYSSPCDTPYVKSRKEGEINNFLRSTDLQTSVSPPSVNTILIFSIKLCRHRCMSTKNNFFEMCLQSGFHKTCSK